MIIGHDATITFIPLLPVQDYALELERSIQARIANDLGIPSSFIEPSGYASDNAWHSQTLSAPLLELAGREAKARLLAAQQNLHEFSLRIFDQYQKVSANRARRLALTLWSCREEPHQPVQYLPLLRAVRFRPRSRNYLKSTCLHEFFYVRGEQFIQSRGYRK